MRVTPPVVITDAKLTSSSAAEPHAPPAYVAGTTYTFGDIALVAADFTIYESIANANIGHTPNASPLWWRILGPIETAYNAATTYALGDTCSSATTHRCYESLAAGNIGNPLPVPPDTVTTKWLDVGPTNRWAMFDLARNTQTVHASPLAVVVAPGERINTVGITGVKGTTLVISATSVAGGGIVYPLPYIPGLTYAKGDCVTVGFATCYQSLQDGNAGHAPASSPTFWSVVSGATFDLRTREVSDGYAYFFEPFSSKVSKVVFDVPPYSDIIVTLTLSDTSGNVKCGAAVFGTFVYLGDVQEHATNDGVNFSSITRDAWGNATLVPRRTVPKTNSVLLLDSARVNKALDARVALNAVAALWTGLDDSTSDWFEMTAILGIYKQFLVDSVLQDKATITLELEEI